MHNSLRRAAALFVVAILSITGIVASSAGAQSPLPPAVGAQFHATWSDYTDAQRIQVLDALAAAHVSWVRIDLGWASFESNGPGTVNTWYEGLADRVIDQANARGIKVLATLWRTPTWANVTGRPTDPPADVNDYARLASTVARHFAGRVSAWEVWNEPNDNSYWGGTAAEYAELVKAAYPLIKAGDPKATVVLGGISYNDTAYLRSLYTNGIQGSFDVMATHPYMGVANRAPSTPDDGTMWTLTHVAAVHSLMVANHDGNKPIWFTEFGWSSHPNTGAESNWNLGVTPAQQGQYLIETLTLVTSSFPYVTNVFWYTERNAKSGNIQEDNYGLLDYDLSPKPVYTALKSFLTPAANASPGPAPSTPTSAAPTTTTTGVPTVLPSTTTAPPTTTPRPTTPPPPTTTPRPTTAPPNPSPTPSSLPPRAAKAFGQDQSQD